ncbi:MAG: tyrosine-type recombinase/integrase [Hyphomicrobiaceae bacterium]|nr:tyrosine-type recombinase/integrase [Hyphomicrobiaceae bacterium]
MTNFIPTTPVAANPPAVIAGFLDHISELQKLSRSPATIKAYRSDLRQFARFCDEHSMAQTLPMAPFVIASFISWMAQRGLKAVTIGRRLSAISALHKKSGHEDPTKTNLVSETMDGLRRQRAAAGERANRMTPMDPAKLQEMAGELSGSIVDTRDWAITLLGFSGLLRRSEIAALNHDDVEWRADGIVLHIRRSKTDQGGEGAVVGVPRASNEGICPVVALKSYIAATGAIEGPLFRNHSPAAKHIRIDPRVVASAVKKFSERVNLDPAKYAGHSLRSGGATAMAQKGVDLGLIVNHGRWQNPQTVSRHYIRPANALGVANPMREVL